MPMIVRMAEHMNAGMRPLIWDNAVNLFGRNP